jgi:glucan phosphoethanolaminetransferase (alkaline phosphatase superfamily)
MHSPTKKALEVPFFIWHSDSVNENFKKSGRTEIPISTTNLYNILMDYMGIEGIEYKDENAELNILKPNFKVAKYKDLEEGE